MYGIYVLGDPLSAPNTHSLRGSLGAFKCAECAPKLVYFYFSSGNFRVILLSDTLNTSG